MHCARSSTFLDRDIRELWLRMIFEILVTNTDDHLKNHGLLYVRDNRWRLSPLFDVNPQPRRHPHMETGISPIHGYIPSIKAAIDAAHLFDIGDPAEARILVREMAQHLHANWEAALRRNGLRGQSITACAPAFEHERLEEALALSSSVYATGAGR